MALTAADLTRIFKYRAFILGSQAGGALTFNTVLTLLQQQLDNVNATDTALGTTFADEIQLDLDTLDTLDALLTTEQGNAAGALIKADVLEWQPGAKTTTIERRYMTLRQRVARVLSQSYEDSGSGGVSLAYRG